MDVRIHDLESVKKMRYLYSIRGSAAIFVAKNASMISKLTLTSIYKKLMTSFLALPVWRKSLWGQKVISSVCRSLVLCFWRLLARIRKVGLEEQQGWISRRIGGMSVSVFGISVAIQNCKYSMDQNQIKNLSGG